MNFLTINKPGPAIRILIFAAFSLFFFLPCKIKAQSSQIVVNGTPTQTITFPSGGCIYNWVNSNPSIGLPATGTGNIASFNAVNNGTTPVIATITALPNSSDYAYIANSGSNNVSVVDLNSNSIKTTIPVGLRPYGLALTPDGSKAYVTNLFSADVSVISTASNTVVATIPVGTNPNGVVVSADGSRVYVTTAYGNRVSVINADNNTVIATVPINYAHSIAISPEGKKLYVSSATGNVYVINTTNNTIINNLTFGPNPTEIVTSQDGTKFYLVDRTKNVVYTINASNYAIEATIPVGSYANGIVISPDGKKLYVANNGSDNISVINTADNTVVATIASARYPDGISINADGSKLYVVNNYSNTLSVISTTTNSVETTVPVGLGPISLGNFIKSGCNGRLVTFTITVNTAPTITAAGLIPSLTTVYGDPSISQQFTMSGSGIIAGVVLTPPTGFEISSDNITFGNTLTIGPAGNIPSTIIYIRLKSGIPVGTYNGNIVLTSTNAQNVNINIPQSSVTPAQLIITAKNVTKTYGTTLTGSAGSTTFTTTGLKNNETIGSVTITYGVGAESTAGVSIYNGSVKVNSPVGGTFALSNYSPNIIDNDIIIDKAPLIITASDKRKFQGDKNPVLTITYSGFVNNETEAQLINKSITTTTAVTNSAVGQYPIDVSGGLTNNYNITYVSGILDIVPTIITPSNTFTPNGDGINDSWDIKYLSSYSNAIVEVFNRFGTKVFFSVGYPVAWDGKYNGVNLSAGVYYYIIDIKNGTKPIAGYLTILR